MSMLERMSTIPWNNRSEIGQPDGSVIITLSKRGEGKVYRFRVKDLYGKNEEVISEEVKEI